jgi:hypothetical protein
MYSMNARWDWGETSKNCPTLQAVEIIQGINTKQATERATPPAYEVILAARDW